MGIFIGEIVISCGRKKQRTGAVRCMYHFAATGSFGAKLKPRG